MNTYDCLISGRWVPATGGERIDVLDPATGEILARIARGGPAEIDQAMASSAAVQKAWAQASPADRGRVLHAVSAGIRARRDELAALESRDTGKPLKQAVSDVDVAIRFFEFYAGAADKILGRQIPLGPGFADFTVREPLGITAHIVPWNYPLQIASRSIAPALACGNTVVLKPAELACLSVFELARICADAGLPPGVLNIVPGYGAEAGAALARHPLANLVVFTGSVGTGIDVTRAAAGNVVPVLLELGGKSPNILLADADLDRALPVVMRSAFPNTGQTCSAGTRVLVHRDIHQKVVGMLADLNRRLTVGPGPTDCDLGAVISARQRQKVEDYIGQAESEGARVLTGGQLAPQADQAAGNYVMPTLLDDVTPDMTVHREEIFGPVLSIVPFDTVEEAANLANATDYGLVAGIWGRSMDPVLWLAQEIKAGQVYVNTYGAGGGVELPFGGYKKSGFGREKGVDALLAYTQIKNICIHFRLE